MILVTFALETELAPWRKLADLEPVSGATVRTFDSRLGGRTIRAVLTGVGAQNAQRVARDAMRWQPDICISAGLAGSLRPDHLLGDILAAETVRDFETHRPIESDSSLLELAAQCGARRIGVLGTSNSIISKTEDKQRLGRVAGAVDMESFSVLDEARARHIPAIAIRSISDAADEDLPMDFSQAFDERGEVSIARVVRSLARRPASLPGLLRLAAASRRASHNLAHFLERYLAALQATNSARVPAGSELAIA